MLRAIMADLGPDECEFKFEVIKDGSAIGEVWTDHWARLYDEAETMYEMLKTLLPDNPEVKALVERVEHGPELTFDGITKQEMLEEIVGGKQYDK